MKTETRAKTKTRAPRETKRARLTKRIDAALTELQRVELVRASAFDDGEFVFKHALVQDTAQSTLLHGEYKRLNLLVAQAYEKIYPAQTMNEYAAVLAQHYDAAGDDAKTLLYATRAGDLAARVYANAEAVEFYTHAIDHAQKTLGAATPLRELFAKRGRAHELTGNYNAALANYGEMENVAHARNDRALELAALMARATIHSTPTMQFNPAHARALCENALALARELNDRAAQAKILWNLMLLSHYSAQYTDAIAYGKQAIALARELNLREQLAYALNDISRSYFVQNQGPEGLAAANEATALWRALGNQPMLADNLNTLATFYANFGERERALAYSAEAYQLGQQINNPWTMAHSCMTNSIVYLESGNVSDALVSMHQCLHLAQQANFQIALVTMRMLLAFTYAELGDIPRGMTFVQTQAADSSRAWDLSMLGVLAALYVRQGDLETARHLLAQFNRTTDEPPPNPFVGGTVRLAEAELALGEGDAARALALVDEHLPASSLGRVRSLYMYFLLLKARALHVLGRLEEAVTVLEQVREFSARVGSRRILWQCLALLGDIEIRRGNAAQANAYRERARDALKYIVEHIPDEYGQSFLNVPQVRAVWQTDNGVTD